MTPLPLWMDLPLFPVVLLSLLGWGVAGINLIQKYLPAGWGTKDLFQSALDRLLFSFALGLGEIALVVLFLGVMGLLFGPILWVVTLLGCLFLLWRREQVQIKPLLHELRPATRSEWLPAVGIGLFLFYLLSSCFLPAIGHDEITYHLTAPRQFLLAGEIHETPHLLFGQFPFNMQMVYLWCLSTGHEMLCKMLYWSVWVGVILGIFSWMKKIDRNYAWLAALAGFAPVSAAFIRAPLETGSDLPVALYFTLGMLTLQELDRQNWPGRVFLPGVFNGLAWGTKYIAVAFVTPPLFVFALWQWWKKGISWEKSVSALVVFGMLTGLLFLPWAVKSWVHTGSPVFPMLSQEFNCPPYYQAMADRCMTFEEQWNFYEQAQEFSQTSRHLSIPELVGAAFYNYKTERVLWSSREGDFLLLLFLVFSLSGLFLPDSRVRGLALAGLTANVIFIFLYGTHLNRYFSVTYSLAAILAVVHLRFLFRMTSFPQLLAGFTSLILLFNLASFQIEWSQRIEWNGLPRLTGKGYWEYLENRFERTDIFALWRQLPQMTPSDAYLLGHGVRAPLHCPRRIYSTGYFEPELIEFLMNSGLSGEELAAELQRQGFDYLLIDRRDPKVAPIPQDWLEKYTEPVGSEGAVELYRFSFTTPTHSEAGS